MKPKGHPMGSFGTITDMLLRMLKDAGPEQLRHLARALNRRAREMSVKVRKCKGCGADTVRRSGYCRTCEKLAAKRFLREES